MPYSQTGKWILPVKARLLIALKKKDGKTEFQLQSELKIDSTGHLNRMLHNLQRDGLVVKNYCKHCHVGKVWHLI